MILKNTIAILKEILIDIFITLLSLSLSVLFSTIILIMITGSREEGMAYGVITGFCVGVIAFYYSRRKFGVIWTAIQVFFNLIITAGFFMVVIEQLENKGFSKMYDGYILLGMIVPVIISVNKLLLDYLTNKIIELKRPVEKV